MTDRTVNEPTTLAEPKQQAQKLAVVFAAIAASQAPGHSGYSVGINSIREARSLVLKTITERRGRIVKTGDNLVVSCLTEATEALKTAITIQRSAVENRDRKVPLNIRIFIHYGEGPIREEDLQKELSIVVAKMTDVAKGGHIYVSMETYNNARGLNAVEFRPLGANESARIGQMPFYDVAWHPETDCTPGSPAAVGARGGHGDTSPFVHGAALVAGIHAPCFYCGSGKHLTTACPSKRLPYATNGLPRLGYLSINEINRLFSDYLSQSEDDLPTVPEPASKEDQSVNYLAPWSFYELKRVFQLRFLEVVWNASPKADWLKAREKRAEGFPEGGMLWLARDCIRTSRLEEAEELLRRYGRMNSRDYRAACGLAFVKVEKGSYVLAADFLNEALSQAVGNLQMAYLLLLLSRVYEFVPDLSKADESLRDALGIEPFCPEATFELIIRHLRSKRESDAVTRLVRLIHICKEYYPAALISPELARFHETTSPELEKLMAQTRGEAEKAVREAEGEVAILRGFVGENDRDVGQVLSSHTKMFELMKKPEALFNYYEAVDAARSITAACKDLDRERAEYAAAAIRAIEARLGEAVRGSSQPQKAMALFQPVLDRVLRLKEDLRARAPLAPTLAQCEEMEREVGALEVRVRQVDARHAFLQLWKRLLRDVVLASFVTVIVGFVLFPGSVGLLRTIRPDSLPLEPTDVWAGQKAILVTGSLFAVLFAALHALLSKRKPHGMKS